MFLFALAAYDLTCSLLSQRLDQATSISKVECHIAYRFCAILWCSVKTLSARRGQFNNDHGDSNENVKKAIGLHSKQKTALHVHHSLYISLPSLYDCDVKMRNFSFYGGRKQATTNFPFSF